MKYLFFCILLLPLYGCASNSAIEIYEHFSVAQSSLNQQIYKETHEHFSVDDIRRRTDTGLKLATTPSTQDTYWIKFSLCNTTSTPQIIVLEHPRAGLDFIDLYVFKENILYQKSNLGDMRPKENRSIMHRNSAEVLTLEPKTSYTIISRLQSYGPYELWWSIESLSYFTQHASIKSIVWGIVGGILLALILYSVVLYFSLHEISYLILGSYALSLLLFRYFYEGFVYQYFSFDNPNLMTIATWVWIRLALVFLLLFPYFFFQLQKEWLGKIFLGFAFFDIGLALLYSCAIFDMNILYYTQYTMFIGLLFALFLVIFCVIVIVQKRPGSLYFAIAKGIFILCAMYDTLIIGGHIKSTAYSWLILPFGIVIDLFFLSLAHGEKIKRIKKEHQESENLLIAQSRFIAIGQTIGNVTHQWKTPIAQLASQFMFLHATFIHKKESLVQEFEKKIPQILQSITYIQESMDLFNNFYTLSNDKSRFNPIEEIKTIERMQEVKLMLNTIELKVDSDIDTLYTHKSALMNSLMILCENAIEALIQNDPIQKCIEISLRKQESSQLTIVVQDNAGKVDTTHIQQLFSSHYSTKKKDNFGLGLCIVKTLVEKKLEGKISVKNTNNGLSFTLTIPYE